MNFVEVRHLPLIGCMYIRPWRKTFDNIIWHRRPNKELYNPESC